MKAEKKHNLGNFKGPFLKSRNEVYLHWVRCWLGQEGCCSSGGFPLLEQP